MRQAQHMLPIHTRGPGLVDITGEVAAWLRDQRMTTGLITLFCRHTSASLLIQENADPDVRRDLEAFFARIAPEASGRYAHEDEGPDDMPAHLRTALTQVQLSIPVTLPSRRAIKGRHATYTWRKADSTPATSSSSIAVLQAK